MVDSLDRAGVLYMLTGSLVSSMQGEPRSSHDIDVVVALRLEHVAPLQIALPPPRFYLDFDAAVDAVNRDSMFNVIDGSSGDKVDFWMLTTDPFDAERFSRRVRVVSLGITLSVSTPEDTILAKLRWAKLSGGSEKQFGDALGVFEVQRPRLDLTYLDLWATHLGVVDLWQRLLREAIDT